MATVRDQIAAALRELGIIGITETPEADLENMALGLYNRVLDEWNATRRAVYADVHSSLLALSAGTNPHTIGASGGTWTSTGHPPVTIEGIRLTTDEGETFLPPLVPRSAEWWHATAAPGVTSAYPTDFYYNRTHPLGSIYFWPEPSSSAVKAQLWYRTVLASVTAATTFTMPPGYDAALVETLKERLTALPMFASMASAGLADAARLARGRAFATNDRIPTLTNDLTPGPRVYRVETGPFSLLRR